MVQVSWEASREAIRWEAGRSGMGPKVADQPLHGVWGCLETKLHMFAPERGPLKAPPVSLPIPTGVFQAGTLNSHARSRGSPELVMGSQNVTAAIQPVLSSN